jgi:hypothetical protein
MNDQTNINANEINLKKWTLFDKVMYGGLGYGAFCLPTNFFKIILTIIFPPLGQLINNVGSSVSSKFPYFNWNVLVNILSYDNMHSLIYSFLLTTLFYIPGLVYTLTNISDSDNGYNLDTVYYSSDPNPYTTQPETTKPMPTARKFG